MEHSFFVKPDIKDFHSDYFSDLISNLLKVPRKFAERCFHFSKLDSDLHLTSLEIDFYDYDSMEFLEADFSQFENLTLISLWNYKYDSFPKSIAKLKNLKSIEFNRCLFTNIPNIFRQCSTITDLKITTCKNLRFNIYDSFLDQITHLSLISLDKQFYQSNMHLLSLKNLKNFFLRVNDYCPDLTKLSAELEELSIETESFFQFDKLPTDLFDKIKSLRNLSLDLHYLENIPNNIENLHNLKSITISSHSLKIFPETLYKCSNLEELSLTDTTEIHLPSNLTELQQLNTIRLKNIDIDKLDSNDVLFNLNLSTLILNSCKISQNINVINKLGNLEKLHIIKLYSGPDFDTHTIREYKNTKMKLSLTNIRELAVDESLDIIEIVYPYSIQKLSLLNF